MERLSAFMDGELDAHEAAGQLRRLKEDPQLLDAWETYHLIGDAMRGEAGYAPGLAVKISSRLAAEPTVLAPGPRMQLRNVRRLAFSAAASIAGVALVAWLALFDNPFVAQQNLAVKQGPPAVQTQLAATPANGAVNDYLLAHQQFSPSTAMQGVASYVRTVSGQNPEQR
ncbi:MAG: sigma-E factor negative regulatory protein [Betaproteobacteria bacterium]